jgi:hypothetical protein
MGARSAQGRDLLRAQLTDRSIAEDGDRLAKQPVQLLDRHWLDVMLREVHLHQLGDGERARDSLLASQPLQLPFQSLRPSRSEANPPRCTRVESRPATRYRNAHNCSPPRPVLAGRIGCPCCDITNHPFPSRKHRLIVKDVLPGLDAISNELNDKAHLSLAKHRLGRAHDPELAANLKPIANLERLVTAQRTGRDHLVPAPELIAIVDLGHGQLRRYAPPARDRDIARVKSR